MNAPIARSFDRRFVLVLVALIVGFVFTYLSRDADDVPRPPVASAEAVLDQMYSGQFRVVFESLSPSARERCPYGRFAEKTRMTMSQFAAPPKHRRFVRDEIVDGHLLFTFDADFDDTSHYREVVTYVKTGDRWSFSRCEVMPRGWPLAMEPMPVSSANDLIAEVKSQPMPTTQAVKRWVQKPGWDAQFDGIVAQKGSRTCDVRLRERASGAAIVARNVLDGCRLASQQALTVVGRIDTVTPVSVEMSEVRFWSRG